MNNYREISENIKRYRYQSSLTQEELAERSGLSLPTIKNIECGKPGMRMSTIEAIASALNVDTAALSRPARRLHTIRFRACRNMRSKEGVIAQIIDKLDVYNDLEQLTGHYMLPLYKRSESGGSPAECAAECRKLLNMDNLSPVADVTQAISDLGIKLLSVGINSEKFFSLSVGESDGGPAIIVNDNKRFVYEQIAFSIAHELGHFFLHRGTGGYVDDTAVWAEEDEADFFASHFLMPEAGFRKAWNACAGLHWTDKVIKVKHIFGVHYKTVLHRLGDFKKLNDRFKEEYRDGEVKDHRDPAPLSKSLFVESRLYGLALTAVAEKKIGIKKSAEMLKIDEDGMNRLAASNI